MLKGITAYAVILFCGEKEKPVYGFVYTADRTEILQVPEKFVCN